MSTALAKVWPLKAEIRLAQAVSEFEAGLSNAQKSAFHILRSQSLSTTPTLSDVMRLTAEVDRGVSKKYGGQCFGPHFTNFLQGVQQFAALGDIVVGGSQNLIACGVWSLVRMSLLSVVSLSTYVDKLSSLFMDIGRTAPRQQAMALLYPRSIKLQSYLSEYFIVVVSLCQHLFSFRQKSTVQQFTSALKDSKLKAFRTDLDEWANSIREEVHLEEAQENSRLRALSRVMFKSTSHQHKLASRLQVLDFCSTYNHQTAWKQTRKTGNASFLMQLVEYREWRDSSDPCTLIYTGKLGSGKSVLLANIVDDLHLSVKKEQSVVVAYFFCRHDVPESLKARTILGSLARQMLCTIPDLTILSESCVDVPGFVVNIEEVLELLIRGFPSVHKAYFVLDGLDECDDEEREILVQALRKIQKTLKILFCASFRKEPIIEQFTNTHIVPMPDDNPEIEAFIEEDLMRCLRQERLVLGDPTLILDIQKTLLGGSQGMFLWVALQIQSLCNMKTDQAIREALADLPKDLSETYSRILYKSGNSDLSLQAKTLQLVVAAYRPLTTDELREALSVTPGDTTWDPSKLLNDINAALACCGCLLLVDEEELTVRITHHSVKQYILSGSSRVNSFSAGEAQWILADVVVTYLGFGVFGSELSRARVHPVMAQSAPSTVMHATIGSSSTALAMKLLKFGKQPTFDISKTLAQARGPSKPRLANELRFYTYAISYWQNHVFYVSGQDAVILKSSTKLIQSRMPEVSLVGKDCMFHYKCAAEDGNNMIAKLLLQSGKIDPNAKDSDGFTLLTLAVQYGHKDTVELLLRTNKVDADAKDSNGYTLLNLAVQYGHKEIVELLLSTDKFDADIQDNNGWTPLMLAAGNGHKDTVELLLSTSKVDVNARTIRHGWTPLMLAVQYGYKGTVELLLSTDKVDVNAKDKEEWTLLMCAANNGHKCIVELLLGTGKVDVDAKNSGGWTPLIYAADSGYKDTVELLLGTGNVDPNAKSIENGWTPLMCAVDKGCKDIVELLLSTGKVDIDVKNIEGWTALMSAADKGQKDIVELLLGTGKGDVNARNKYGRTSLMFAAGNGHKDTVKLLLSTSMVDVDAKNDDGWTPLMYAADNGHKDTVELLLSTSMVDVDAKNNEGWTALELAAEYGDKDTVDLLHSYLHVS